MATETTTAANSVDAAEIDRFDKLAATWWDPEGPMRPLHDLNPVRLGYIRDSLVGHFQLSATSLRPFAGLRILDVGCGGGLLCEPLARLGATVTGIDAAAESIAVATDHASRQDLDIDYRCTTAETLQPAADAYDCVVSMEVVEHVANVDAFLTTCVGLTAPGGALLLSTLNRTAKSYLTAILGAEYILRWLPRGTHSWEKFVKPAELRRTLARGGAEVRDVTGLSFELRSRTWQPSDDRSVNYLVYGAKKGTHRLSSIR